MALTVKYISLVSYGHVYPFFINPCCVCGCLSASFSAINRLLPLKDDWFLFVQQQSYSAKTNYNACIKLSSANVLAETAA